MERATTANTGGGSLTVWATSEVFTRHGPARVTSFRQSHPHGHVVLLHGAGTGSDAPALVGIGKAMAERGWDVALLEQPYRVASTRRPPAPAAQLDEVVRTVIDEYFPDRQAPLVVVGRSSGARVACRIALSIHASLVVALGFPLTAPNGASRQSELDGAGVPVFIVQGTKDSFGMPRRDARRGREVYRMDGADHALERPRSQEDPLEEVVLVVAERLDLVAKN